MSALEQPGNFALYTYSRNSPIAYKDPDGKEPYLGTRDLAGFTFGYGAHGFAMVVTDNPAKYGPHESKFQTFTNQTGEFPGVEKGRTFYIAVLSGTPNANTDKLEKTLTEPGDIRSI